LNLNEHHLETKAERKLTILCLQYNYSGINSNLFTVASSVAFTQ